MARPRTALGTSGTIRVVPQVQNDTGRWINASQGTKPQRWRARVSFRDADGVARDVERFAATRARAEANLKAALRERKAPANGDTMRSDMSVTAAGEVWLTQVRRPDSKL